jgi:hypothetical protein
MIALEKGWPTFNTRGTFMRILRLSGAIGVTAGFIIATTRSSRTSFLLDLLPTHTPTTPLAPHNRARN